MDMPAARRADLLQGTLDLLILRTLTLEPQHGWGIARRIHQLTQGTFDVRPGSMFPALKRLEEKGFIKAEWRLSETNRRSKYYRLTPSGRRMVTKELEQWYHIVDAVRLVIEGTS